MTEVTHHVQIFAASEQDEGPIDAVPKADVLVSEGESVGAVLDRAVEVISSRYGAASGILNAYPYVLTREVARDVSQFQSSGAMRTFTLTADGALCCPRDIFSVPWVDLERALAQDPTAVRTDAVVISRDGPWGGLEPLFEGAVGALAGGAGTAIASYVLQRFSLPAPARIRRITKAWLARDLDHPRVIDAWFEKRARWDRERVAQLLRLTMTEAKWVLKNLGYEPLDGEMWVRSYSAEALGLRRRWDLFTD